MPPEWANWLNVALNVLQFAIVVGVGRRMWVRLRKADQDTAQAAEANWQESRIDRTHIHDQLAGVQVEIGGMKSDQEKTRLEVAHQRETLNRIIVRLDRLPTQQDMELGLLGLQSNIALILAGRPPQPLHITQRNGPEREGGTDFHGATTVQGPVVGGDAGTIGPPKPTPTERPHTV